MGRSFTAIQFFTHYWRSKRWDSFHSPYLFRLLTYCCNEQNMPQVFTDIEGQRKNLKRSTELIARQDFGAGSSFHTNQVNEPVSKIARRALSLPFQCRFLFRLAEFHKPGQIVEFGTSLGISTAYLASGAPGASIDTIEGDPAVAAKAAGVFEALGIQNIHLHLSTFETYIGNNNPDDVKIDLLFIDGHHNSTALWGYFDGLKNRFHEHTIVVVDDIYWSADMNTGWEKLISLPEVIQSVDCFHFGLLFFNPGFLNRENHIVHLPLNMIRPRI